MENELLWDRALAYLSPNELLKVGTVSSSLKKATEKDALWQGFFPEWYKATLNWKMEYIRYLKQPAEWLKMFNPPKHTAVVHHRDVMEASCIRVMYNEDGKPVFYIGSKFNNPESLHQVHLYSVTNSAWRAFPEVTTLSIGASSLAHHSNLLAAGARDSIIYLIDTRKHEKLEQDSIVGKMEVKSIMPTYGQCSWMHIPIFNMNFTKSGKYLFSTSPGKLNGVTMWDVETQKAVHVFNHHLTGDWEMENALYGQRSKHEIYSVCPTFDGEQFVSGSYDNFYHWDTRTEEMIKMHTLRHYMPNKYELSDIYLTRNMSELLVYGRREPIMKTFEFPSMVPTAKQFTDTKEFYALDFRDNIGFGADSYGGFYQFDCTAKTWRGIERGVGDFLIGSGANDCHISDSGLTVGLAFANPLSGYQGTRMVAFSVEDMFFGEKEGPPPRAPNQKKPAATGEKKKCLLQ